VLEPRTPQAQIQDVHFVTGRDRPGHRLAERETRMLSEYRVLWDHTRPLAGPPKMIIPGCRFESCVRISLTRPTGDARTPAEVPGGSASTRRRAFPRGSPPIVHALWAQAARTRCLIGSNECPAGCQPRTHGRSEREVPAAHAYAGGREIRGDSNEHLGACQRESPCGPRAGELGGSRLPKGNA
jgi:hypothetical protein